MGRLAYAREVAQGKRQDVIRHCPQEGVKSTSSEGADRNVVV